MFCSGILVILDIVFSISDCFTVIFFLFFLAILSIAPVSSITSIALSGKNLSLIYFEDRSTDASTASFEYETL